MSKKMMKRSLALGALMAFVITGSATAADMTTKVANDAISKFTGNQISGTENGLLVVNDGQNYVLSAGDGSVLNVTGTLSTDNIDEETPNGGIFVNGSNSSLTIERDIKITIDGTSNKWLTGIHNFGGALSEDIAKLNVNKNIDLTVNSDDTYNRTLNGVRTYNSETNFNGAETNITLNTKNSLKEKHVYGVASLGTGWDANSQPANTVINFNSANTNIVVNNENEKAVTVAGVFISAANAKVNFNDGNIIVDVNSGKAGYVLGLYNYKNATMTSNENSVVKIYADGNANLVLGINSSDTIDFKGTTLIDVANNGSGLAMGFANDNNSTANMADVTIEASAKEGTAYGVLSEQGSTVNLADTTITATSAEGNAYGIYATSSKVKVDGDLTVNATGGLLGRGVEAREGSKITLGNEDKTNNINITASGNKAGDVVAGIVARHNGSEVKVYADELYVTATATGNAWAYGVNANTTTTAGVANFILDANKTVITTTAETDGQASAIVAMSGSGVSIKGDLTAKGDNVLLTRGQAATVINESGEGTVELDGDICFTASKDAVIDADVNINLNDAESYLNGNIYASDSRDNEIDGMTLSVSNGAQWTATADSFVNNLTVANGGKVTMAGEDTMTITVDTLYGEDGVVETNNLGNKMTVKETGDGFSNLTVQATGDAADNIAAAADQTAELQKLADVVATETESGTRTSIATTVTTEDGDIAGAYSAQVGEDGKVIAKTITKAIAQKNENISDATMNLKAHWRAHMNDMNKRMGDLRLSNGETGVWTRMVRGESEYDGSKVQYNQYQLGYDEKLSVDKRWTVGAAVTFSEGDGSYGSGTTDDKSTAFAIYGSKLNNDGTFVDLIARYARVESDLEDVHSGNGDYSTNGYSVSAEFGKRIEQTNGLWVEPQVELTYGTIDSADFTLSKGKEVHVDSMDSLVARLGLSIGKDIKQGNVYARASYLYDFDGESETSFSRGAVQGDVVKEDFGGGWWEVGVGANINLSKATYIYADVEKTFGGEVDTNWQWNLGVRYSF